MNFFKIKTTWTNLEFIPLKLAIASAYLLIGNYFGDFVNAFKSLIFIVFIITVVWSVYLWIRKMNASKEN